MDNILGIDHPLILVRDIERARCNYEALGFTLTPLGTHPWGTSTCTAVMQQSLVELMSIADDALLDRMPAGRFRFGRYVAEQLAEREGVSLLALYSDNAERDTIAITKRGVDCQGTINFGRDVILPDGSRDQTSATLKIIQDPELPRLSNFICQQRRPDLIYVPSWSQHVNGAIGYSQVTILAEPKHQSRVRTRLSALYGEQAIMSIDGGFAAKTGNGSFVVYSRTGIESRYGSIPIDIDTELTPFYAALHFRVKTLGRVETLLNYNNIKYRRFECEVRVSDPRRFGNVFINFTDGDILV